jgi:hypothetical protein
MVVAVIITIINWPVPVMLLLVRQRIVGSWSLVFLVPAEKLLAP